MSLVSLEVIAPVPTSFFHCSHCEQIFTASGIGKTVRQEMHGAYPPSLLSDVARLDNLLHRLSSQYRGRLHIRVIDMQSIEGFYESLRFGIRSYPGFIINRQTSYSGWDTDEWEQRLAERLSSPKEEARA
jgi:hypothetical protein